MLYMNKDIEKVGTYEYASEKIFLHDNDVNGFVFAGTSRANGI